MVCCHIDYHVASDLSYCASISIVAALLCGYVAAPLQQQILSVITSKTTEVWRAQRIVAEEELLLQDGPWREEEQEEEELGIGAPPQNKHSM